jgi:DNA-binding MarR family transcriptional regulator
MLNLTPRGRDLLDQILPAVLAHSRQALSGFTAAEMRMLFKLLRRMADNIAA